MLRDSPVKHLMYHIKKGEIMFKDMIIRKSSINGEVEAVTGLRLCRGVRLSAYIEWTFFFLEGNTKSQIFLLHSE